ncbi:MAG TPA: hypothetical protein PKD17_10675, partial [Cellvibrionaceae bacterium]|nr:hypothetical protein [Cellvibrionaceae bacterium]
HTKTPVEIYVAEAKSSVNGADAARAPAGAPDERLRGWLDKYNLGGFDTATPEGRAVFDQIQSLCGINLSSCNIRGIWAQVEVPRTGASNVSVDASLNATLKPLDATLKAW